MHMLLLAVGTRQPVWINQGFAEYAGRLPPECKLVLKEIALGKRRGGEDISRAVAQESVRMLAAIPAGAGVIALDVRGRSLSTEELAKQFNRWLQSGHDQVFLVGGPDGLARDCLARAELTWSLSPLTLPHGLVRVVVAEQLYRAWTILKGHPYHRA